MDFSVLLGTLDSLIDSIITNDPEKVSNHVNSIREKKSQLTTKQIAEKIVGEQSFYNGLFGAGTGAFGLMALPATIPTDLVKAWKIQAFTIRCIAYCYGYTDQTTDLKTDIYLLLSSDSMATLKEIVYQQAVSAKMQAALAVETMKQSVTREALKAAPKYVAQAVVQVAGKEAANYAMKGIPKHIAKALWSIGGRKVVEGAIQKSLTKAIPVVGAITGFAFDWTSTKAVGKLAIEYYEKSGPDVLKSAFQCLNT